MKKCPQCGREYDNSMMFCLDDGAELLYGPASVDEPATAILSEPGAIATGFPESKLQNRNPKIETAHVAAGGVAPIPMYLKQTSEFLRGKPVTEETITAANEIMQSEISPISDVRGTEAYKRLLLSQLFTAHFYELFGPDAI